MGQIAIDAHFHADILMSQQPEFINTYRALGIGGLAWSYAHNIASWRDYSAYWQNLAGSCAELSAHGVPCAYLVGIHPRCIPDDLSPETGLPQELEQEMLWHLNRPSCRGMGELGLDTGGERETKILCQQLDMATHSLPEDKKIGIHTPRRNKLEVTRRILEVLRLYPALQNSFLVDHLNSTVLSLILEQGFMLGMTLQPGKSDLDELRSVLKREPQVEDRLMVNSDGAQQLSEPFVQGIREGLPRANRTWQKVFYGNAREFWGLK